MKKSLFQIQSPEELKQLSLSDLLELSKTVKHDIIQQTAVNGGHIGASLCCVDMIVAMHKVFDTPKDCFIFDVGHQAYAHKMLTGRRHQFYKLRKENGVSGFTNRWETEHDSFGAGHASTSISAALGILEGKKIIGDDGYVVAVVGDGALTGGLTFEGFNNLAELKRNLIIVLNDNQMSIDPNVGGLKLAFENNKAKEYFELFGIEYWGPSSGHNILEMMETFQKAKRLGKPVLIHLLTTKGESYAPAIKDKIRFHGCGPFDIETGNAIQSTEAKKKYQDLFAETLTEMASQDDRIVAITAAMPSGTSLKKFQRVHPERFYDVGLAEPHAVEFGAGLATQGVKPFVCVYSTFLQRAYDQLIHDVALQNLPVRICMDRGGLVGDDGATHQGVFDYAYLCSIPNFVVMAPKDEVELQNMMETARLHTTGPISVRFPRGEVLGLPLPQHPTPLKIGRAEHLYGDLKGDVLICAIGTPVHSAVDAAKHLEVEHDINASVINLRFAKPLDEEMIVSFAQHFKAVITVEEGVRVGGVGSMINELLNRHNILMPIRNLGVPDKFIEHASQNRQREMCGIDAQAMIQTSVDVLREIEDSQREIGTVTRLPFAGESRKFRV